MKEVEFGYRIRQALNEGAERLDYRTTFRLERARQAALARHPGVATAPVWVPALRTATAGGPALEDGSDGLWGWLQRMGLIAPLLALILGFVAIYQWQDARRIAELADLDFAVLLDETPLSAYADQGFSIFLRESGEL